MRPASSNQISAIRNKKHLQIHDCLLSIFGDGFAPKRFLTPFKFRSSQRLHNSPINGFKHTYRAARLGSPAWRRLYGEKTVRTAERRINGNRPHFLRENVLFSYKMGPVPIYLPKVASSILKYPYVVIDCFLITEKELLTSGM